jgi:hypothetical protein
MVHLRLLADGLPLQDAGVVHDWIVALGMLLIERFETSGPLIACCAA